MEVSPGGKGDHRVMVMVFFPEIKTYKGDLSCLIPGAFANMVKQLLGHGGRLHRFIFGSIWTRNYTLLFYMDVITYPRLNPDTTQANSCKLKGSLVANGA